MEVIDRLCWHERDPTRPRSDEIKAARDRILVEALGDTERELGSSGARNDKSFSNPRVCDIAGHVLSRIWGQPNAFDLSGSLRTRNRQRLELENIWRRKQGLQALPIPEPRRPTPLSDDEFGLLLQAVQENSSTNRSKAISTLEARGLAALPPLRKWLATKGGDGCVREALQAAACRLASTVNEIEIPTESVRPDSTLRRRIDELKGKPLNGEAVTDLLLAVASSLPEGVGGIEISIEREGDDTAPPWASASYLLPAGYRTDGRLMSRFPRVGSAFGTHQAIPDWPKSGRSSGPC